jgi:drug/metabolite transporter (DMT)-like permease
MKSGRLLVYVGILIAMVCWSFSFLWYKEAYVYLQPFTTIFTRLVISSVLLFAFSMCIGKLQKVRLSDFKNLLLLALFEPFLYFIGESLGMQYITPTTASVIISLVPLLVPFFAYFIIKEKLGFKNILGIFISFMGVLFVIFNKNMEMKVSVTGVLLMGLSVIGATFYSIFLKKLTTLYNPLTLIAWQNTMGAIMFLPLVLIYDVKGWHMSMLDLKAVIPVAKLAIFASSIAFLLYTNGVKVLGAVRSNIFTNLIPVMTALFSVWLLDEKLLLHNVAGILLVIGGLIMSQLDSIKMMRKSKIRVEKIL